MNKLIIFCVLSLLIFGCKKAREEIRVGRNLQMEKQTHCIKVSKESVNTDVYPYPEYKYHDSIALIDVDFDGKNDFLFRSSFEFNPDDIYTSLLKNAEVVIINNQFSIPTEIDRSIYFKGNNCNLNPIFDFYGSYPRRTYETWDGCKKEFPWDNLSNNIFLQK